MVEFLQQPLKLFSLGRPVQKECDILQACKSRTFGERSSDSLCRLRLPHFSLAHRTAVFFFAFDSSFANTNQMADLFQGVSPFDLITRKICAFWTNHRAKQHKDTFKTTQWCEERLTVMLHWLELMMHRCTDGRGSAGETSSVKYTDVAKSLEGRAANWDPQLTGTERPTHIHLPRLHHRSSPDVTVGQHRKLCSYI